MQGQELFDKWSEKLRTRELFDQVASELNEADQLLRVQQEDEENELTGKLTRVAGLFLPIAVMATVLTWFFDKNLANVSWFSLTIGWSFMLATFCVILAALSFIFGPGSHTPETVEHRPNPFQRLAGMLKEFWESLEGIVKSGIWASLKGIIHSWLSQLRPESDAYTNAERSRQASQERLERGWMTFAGLLLVLMLLVPGFWAFRGDKPSDLKPAPEHALASQPVNSTPASARRNSTRLGQIETDRGDPHSRTTRETDQRRHGESRTTETGRW